MKHLFTYLLLFLTGLPLLAATTENKAELKKQAQQWLKEQPVEFTENKGQMTDMQGKLVPFVLYKVNAPGINMYITKKGLTYCFTEEVKTAQKEIKEKKGREAEEEEEEQHRNREREKNKQGEQDGSMEEEGEFEFKPFNWSRIDMDLEGAIIKKENIVTEGRSLMFNQYFLGHCPDGVSDVHTYSKIIIKDVYPGIDWIFYNSSDKGFKYDFAVHPGADPRQIKLLYRSGKKLQLDEQGNIEIKTPYGTLTENAPVSYIKETGENIRTQFVKTKINACRPTRADEGYETSISFLLTSNISHLTSTLIIDPQLIWSTFYGGANSTSWSQDEGITDIETDANGTIFACGYAFAGMAAGQNNFPTIDPGGGAYFQGVFAGGNYFNPMDAVIMKFSSTGVLLWATYYGGGDKEIANSITIDNSGNIFVTGYTGSGYDPIYPLGSTSAFPTLNPAGGAYYQGAFAGGSGTNNGCDVFILKFNNAGVRLWATYYGGGGDDSGNSIIADNSGNVFVTGYTNSHYNTAPATFFPTLNPGGGSYFQGANTANNKDAFILKFTNTGIIQWATFYGGIEHDIGNSITVDNSGNILITGITGSDIKNTTTSSFPIYTPAGTYTQSYGGGGSEMSFSNGDAFILKFSNSGVRLWATFYGGSNNDIGYSIATDCNGNVFVTGNTISTNLPTFNPAGNTYYKGGLSGKSDAFILKFDKNCNRLWATYYGGGMNEFGSLSIGSNSAIPTYHNIQTDECGHVFVSFETGSPDIPVQFISGAYFDGSFNGYNDIYLARFSNTGVLQWGTYFGGDGNDFRSPIALDNNGNLIVAGEWTTYNTTSLTSSTYPLINAGGGAYYDNTFNGGRDDMFIAKLGFEPETSNLQRTQVNPVGCSACNGKARVTAKCDMAGINYVWSTGRTVLNTAAASDSISGLCAGNYWVEVTSACGEKDTARFSLNTINCGCTMSASTVINQDINCPGNTGSATVTISNGPGGPYTYSWSNGTSAITSSISNQTTNLQSGTYYVTISTGSCLTVSTITLSQPTPVLPKITLPLCPSNIGTATVNVTGGTAPYLYNWSNGSTSTVATGLSLGAYTVTVIDSKGCTSSEVIGIKEPFLITIFTQNITCTNWGGAMVYATAGTSLFTYTWSNGSTLGGNCGGPCWNKGLSAGTYTVTITDPNGCTVARPTTISGSSPASATFTSTPACLNQATCFTHTGSAADTHTWSVGPPVSVSGSTANFCYTFLTAGTYSVTHTVTNAGCTNTITQNITVTNCNGPTATAIGSSVCPGSCAAVTSGSTGGSSPYTYLWSTGATTQNINPCPVSTTTYTVTIRDADGNTSTSTAVVTINPTVSVTTTASNISCNGASTGSATATGSSGTSPYTYSWSNLVSGSPVSGLSAGTYTVTVVKVT